MPLTHLSEDLGEKISTAYPSLEAIDLSRNNLCNVPAGCLSGLASFPKTICEVSLAANCITSCPELWNALRCLPALERLDLSHNAILMLPQASKLSSCLPRVTSFNVSFNPLSNLESSVEALSGGLQSLTFFSARDADEPTRGLHCPRQRSATSS